MRDHASNPFANNPLVTRADLQKAVCDLVAPLDRFTSEAGARVVPGMFAATYTSEGAGLEGFARRLWGLAPLAAGGGRYDHWSKIRQGLEAGTDPGHPEYWGDPVGLDVRMVEIASLATALVLARPQLWAPLTSAGKANVERWLRFGNTASMAGNNWQFFRVFGNVGLSALGLEADREATRAALDRIDTMYLGDGWYGDGTGAQRDYYVAFAMHYYGLLYSRLAQKEDPERCAIYRQRATLFAKDFIHWFAPGGAAIPYGRSLTYRFAQASFWGALAFADVEALPWGVIKGLLLRNLRWWAARPVFTDSGVLSIGYGYAQGSMAEQYNAPGSPYWALKAFIPLALPEGHPFWSAAETSMPGLDAVHELPHAGMLMCRDDADDHAVALLSGKQHPDWPMRQGEQKYCKFAYSTVFGFCLDLGQPWADSMISFSEDGRRWVGREHSMEFRIGDGRIFCRWSPMGQVEVETTLEPHGNWHLRTHRICTKRPVQTVEAGFAANAGDRFIVSGQHACQGEGWAFVHGDGGSSGIRDLEGAREASLSQVEPNLNVMHPRTMVPLLRKTLPAGEHVFVTAVLGMAVKSRFQEEWDATPASSA